MSSLHRRSPAVTVLTALAATALVGALSGCGSDDPGTTEPAPSSSTGSAPATGTPTPTPEPSTPEPSTPAPTSGATSSDPGVVGDGDPVTVAFCMALNSAPAQLDPDPAKAARQIHAYGAGLAAVEPPEILADQAVSGLAVLVEFFEDIKPGQVDEFMNANSPEEVLGERDGALVTEFFTETAQLCATSTPSPAPEPSETPTS